ncbi:MAG: HIT domain-containing protein [Bdellovibrionota bacterium]|nr:HIT domain-containing protein [Bdellovibrionota bacterium]
MSDCLFCKFVSGELKTDIIFENDQVLGFKDIYPQAKEHYLFISKKHTANINEMMSSDSEGVLAVYAAIKEFTTEAGLSETGFRVVTNLGRDGGQTIFHTHFHVLAGEALGSFGS